jgi:hypothetical protein
MRGGGGFGGSRARAIAVNTASVSVFRACVRSAWGPVREIRGRPAHRSAPRCRSAIGPERAAWALPAERTEPYAERASSPSRNVLHCRPTYPKRRRNTKRFTARRAHIPQATRRQMWSATKARKCIGRYIDCAERRKQAEVPGSRRALKDPARARLFVTTQ